MAIRIGTSLIASNLTGTKALAYFDISNEEKNLVTASHEVNVKNFLYYYYAPDK
jgi:hypothetical protein